MTGNSETTRGPTIPGGSLMLRRLHRSQPPIAVSDDLGV